MNTLRRPLGVALLIAFVAVVTLLGVHRLYPLGYSGSLREAAGENGLPASLVAAVVREESRFRPGAVSPKGALGLMQLMPSTAEWIAVSLGEDDFEIGDLLEPETNLRMGCWYLAHLVEVFDGSEIPAIAAYNGGVGRVAGWIGEDVWDGSAQHLEDIPTPETREFLRRVLASRRIYRGMFSLLRWE